MGKLKRSTSNQDLRGGYTTGACAAAAARAAVRGLIDGQVSHQVSIQIPNREWVNFTLARTEIVANQNAAKDAVAARSERCNVNRAAINSVLCGVIKDAGDDPDCTHGLEIQCQARLVKAPGIHLKGGLGVAVVTKPGLELPVGEPAINPVPRANIIEMARLEWLNASELWQDHYGVELTIIVPSGRVAAKETINERLGLIGGISILGTRGTVKPYSTSAFAASVRQSIQIAQANGLSHVALTTGSRSEKAAQQLLPRLEPMALIQAGDFIGVGLRAAKRYGLASVTLVVMIGKMGKLISGRMMTHVSGHRIDFTRMAVLAEQSGMPSELCQQIAQANTGRHVLDLVRKHSPEHYFNRLCDEAKAHASHYITDALAIDVVLVDFNGEPLGRSACSRSHL
ncbi:cobalt-precorrin-5B (C(1))-methyltransferase [Vibrio sp. WXL210]|uniref:cobalt-precorrin-5B (C(1))-methyltransferase n=1 Tax=Vibrio sp. WXL210 TaxID=3450709 RepID=UPI003EC91451